MTTEISEGLINLSKELLLVSGEDTNQVFLIDPTNLGIIETFSDDSNIGKNQLVAASAHGSLIISIVIGASRNKTIASFWNINNAKPVFKSPLPEKLSCIQISSDEKHVFGGSVSGVLYLWDTYTGDLICKVNAHYGLISKILTNQDNGMIITLSHDYSINVWLLASLVTSNAQYRRDLGLSNSNQIETVKPFYSLTGHLDSIIDGVLSLSNFGILVTLSLDKTIKIWSISKGLLLNTIQLESLGKCLAMDASNEIVFVGCKNNKIYGYKLKSNQESLNASQNKSDSVNLTHLSDKLTIFESHNQEITCMVFLGQSNVLASASLDKQIIFWSLDGKVLRNFSFLATVALNMVSMLRPQELYKETRLIKQKKVNHFKPFSKNITDAKEKKPAELLVKRKNPVEMNEIFQLEAKKKQKEILHQFSENILKQFEKQKKDNRDDIILSLQSKINDLTKENLNLRESNRNIFISSLKSNKI